MSERDAEMHHALMRDTLMTISTLVFVASAICSMIALFTYLRQPDARLVGFGFARFYYGEMRRTRPLLFVGSLGGAVVGMALMIFAGTFH